MAFTLIYSQLVAEHTTTLLWPFPIAPSEPFSGFRRRGVRPKGYGGHPFPQPAAEEHWRHAYWRRRPHIQVRCWNIQFESGYWFGLWLSVSLEKMIQGWNVHVFLLILFPFLCLSLLLPALGDLHGLLSYRLAFFEVRYQFYRRDKLMWAVIRHYSEQVIIIILTSLLSTKKPL